MNRKQRRSQPRPKSNTRRAGVAYLTVAGLASGSIGLVGPANADEPPTATNCEQANDMLENLTGGTLNLIFTDPNEDECTLDREYSFSQPTTINGPENGALTLKAKDQSDNTFTATSRLEISNLKFTVEAIAPGSVSSMAATPGTIRSFVFGSGSEVVLNNVEFHDANVEDTAIYAEGNLSVTDSSFTNLRSDESGTVIVQMRGTVAEIVNSTFTANVSISEINSDLGPSSVIVTTRGGVINSEGLLTVSNSTFTENQAIVEDGSYDTGDLPEGGAIYSTGSLTIANSTFESNSADGNGGAIYFDSNIEGALSITNSTFSSNTAAQWGGALHSLDEVTFSNSTFESNTARLGGAIHAFGEVTGNNSTFSSNTAGAGGAIMSEGASLTISGSTFFDNIASEVGGAIVHASDPPQIASVDNSTFVNNAIGFSEGNGAALAFYSEGSIISNNTFWNNGNENHGSIEANFTYFFGNILANLTAGVEVIAEDLEHNFDLGANLYTDDSLVFVEPKTAGEGASMQVTVDDLELSEDLSLNQTSPVNEGTTKTVAIGDDSIARDYYSADSAGINPRGLDIPEGNEFATRIAALDQRGVARQPSVNRLDVGAYDFGDDPEPTPSETAEPTPSETAEPTPSETAEPTPSETAETTDTETLAETGLENQTSFLGLIGIGLAAILGASVGLVRRRRKV